MAKSKKKNQKKHAKRRFKERFDIELNDNQYQQICNMIRKGKRTFVRKQ